MDMITRAFAEGQVVLDVEGCRAEPGGLEVR